MVLYKPLWMDQAQYTKLKIDIIWYSANITISTSSKTVSVISCSMLQMKLLFAPTDLKADTPNFGFYC
jgi:hypothetical protein